MLFPCSEVIFYNGYRVNTFYIILAIFLVHAPLSHSSYYYDSPYPTYYHDNSEDNYPSEGYSSPEECARECRDGEAPKICYYSFRIEYYTTMGGACTLLTSNSTLYRNGTQCIMADGYEKTVFVINRQIPGPSIQVCLYDKVVIDVTNEMEGMECSIHWHGIFQNGYQYYDGVPFLTQCPIGSENTFRYQFSVDNHGTHFYHSHISVQMIDGQYGPFIVRRPPRMEPFYRLYDYDNDIILLSDWIHQLSLDRFPGLRTHDIAQTAQNVLINGHGNWIDPSTSRSTNAPLAVFMVDQYKRYRLRIINSFSTVCPAELTISNHRMLVIAQDGEDVQPVYVDNITFTSGERVDVVIYANQSIDSYWIRVRALGECEETSVQQYAILKYNGGPDKPSTPTPTYSETISSGVTYNSLDFKGCDGQVRPGRICINQLKSLRSEDSDSSRPLSNYHIELGFKFYNYSQDLYNSDLFLPGSHKKFYVAIGKDHLMSEVNNKIYGNPPAPPISQVEGYETMCKPPQLSQCTEPCTCTQVIHIPRGAAVTAFVYDGEPNGLYHPFHLHGYSFKVLSMDVLEQPITREVLSKTQNTVMTNFFYGRYQNASRKDTVTIPEGGYAFIQFLADNPGWWLFHCHFSWHTATGMNVVFHVGTPQDLPPVPAGFPKCYNWTPQPRFNSVL